MTTYAAIFARSTSCTRDRPPLCAPQGCSAHSPKRSVVASARRLQTILQRGAVHAAKLRAGVPAPRDQTAGPRRTPLNFPRSPPGRAFSANEAAGYVSRGNRIWTRRAYGRSVQPADQEASMRVFIGLDVSLTKIAVCVVDHDGAVQWLG